MANPTSNFNWQMPTSSDLVTDLPADFEVFGQAVDTSLADLKGGTTGQVLKKNSNTDMDFVWGADSAGMTNPMTTTGDTIYSSSGSTPARLGIGSTGNVLTVAGGVPTWAAPAAPTSPTLSLIASGTASGASLTLSGLSSYDTIRVLMFELNRSTAGQLRCRINNDSTSNYWASTNVQTGSTTNLHFINAADGIYSYDNMISGATNGNVAFTFNNCKAAGYTQFDVQSTYINNASANQSYSYAGVQEVNAAVSSLVFSGNWAGTTNYRIYGA